MNIKKGPGVKAVIRWVNSILVMALILLLFNAILACSSIEENATGLAASRDQIIREYYLATVEPGREFTEIDEINGVDTTYISTARPDLTIESITWSPENPSTGDNVTINVTLSNKGNRKAIASRVTLHVDGYFRDFQYVQSLEVGESVIKDFAWVATQGSHTIKMIVDEENWILESDEDNNEKSVTIPTFLPDLIIETITWSPSDPSEGDNVTFTATTRNQGEGKAINPLVVFHVDDNRLAATSIGSVDSGGIYSTDFTWVARRGVHIIKLIIDPANNILESDESNNEKIADFPTLYSDLIVQSITWSPTDPHVGDEVTFSVTIKNQGYVPSNSSRFNYYFGDSSGFKALDLITMGSSVIETFTWFAKAGSSKVRVVIDPGNLVTENDEDNNEMTVIFSGTKIPDLVVESITWSPSNPSVGETMTISVTVKNTGVGRASSSRVTCYIDNNNLASSSIDSINPGGVQSRTFAWTVQEDYHTIKVIADSNVNIPESNETNNEKMIVYPIPPDLIIKEVASLPTKPVEGDNVSFTVTVENQGDSIADVFSIGHYIDDTFLGYLAADAINPSATDNYTFKWIAVAGTHIVKAIVDPHDKVLESNEYNNEKIFLSEVVASLTTTQLTPSPPTAPDTEVTETQTEIIEPISTTDTENQNNSGSIDSFNYGFISFFVGGVILMIISIFFWIRQRGS
ncbi:CARDB domain-containing protein [Chloroflexota bacterium]